jgi:hypothetical protein
MAAVIVVFTHRGVIITGAATLLLAMLLLMRGLTASLRAMRPTPPDQGRVR